MLPLTLFFKFHFKFIHEKRESDPGIEPGTSRTKILEHPYHATQPDADAALGSVFVPLYTRYR